MAESLWYATCTECAWVSEPTADQAAAIAAGAATHVVVNEKRLERILETER